MTFARKDLSWDNPDMLRSRPKRRASIENAIIELMNSESEFREVIAVTVMWVKDRLCASTASLPVDVRRTNEALVGRSLTITALNPWPHTKF